MSIFPARPLRTGKPHGRRECFRYFSPTRFTSANPAASVDSAALEKSIASATEALLGYCQSDGHWVFELEADATIPSEYVLLRHYLAEPVDTANAAVYLASDEARMITGIALALDGGQTAG